MKTFDLILVFCVSQCLCSRQSFLSYTLATQNGATLLFQAIGLGNTLQHNTDNPVLNFEEFAPSATLNSNNSPASRQDASVSRPPCKTQVTVRGPHGRLFLPSARIATSFTFTTSVFNYATTKYCYSWVGAPAAIKPSFCRRKRSLEYVNRLHPTDVLGLETTAVPHFDAAELIPNSEHFSSLKSSLTDDLQTDCEPNPDEASETKYELQDRVFFNGNVAPAITTTTITLLTASITATSTSRILFGATLGAINTYCIPHEFSTSAVC